MSHKTNVMELIARPILAHRDLSLNIAARNIAARPTAKNTGGPNIIAVSTRDPKGEPHPKRGILIRSAADNQGNMAPPKLTLPRTFDTTFLFMGCSS